MKRNGKVDDEKVLEFIKGYILENGYSPTYEEMRTAIGLASKATVFEVIGRLEAAGKITFGKATSKRRSPRCIKVTGLRFTEEKTERE